MSIPQKMTADELLLHAGDIQRQAIELYKTGAFFVKQPRLTRWRLCLRIVAQAWMTCGPQSYGPVGPAIIPQPPREGSPEQPRHDTLPS